MSNLIRNLSEYRGCLSVLEEGGVNLGRYVHNINAEFSLRNRLMDIFSRRESRMPQLLRETAEIYSACRQVVSEKSTELEANRRTLTAYISDRLSRLEQYSREERASVPDIEALSSLKERIRSKSLEDRVSAKKALLETKLGAFDSVYQAALHNDRVLDTESKVSDVEYLIDIISILSNTFSFASDKLAREEEHLNAITESVCSVIELGKFSRQITSIGDKVRRTINGSYRAFEESTLRIRSALKSLEAPRLANRPKGRKQLDI